MVKTLLKNKVKKQYFFVILVVFIQFFFFNKAEAFVHVSGYWRGGTFVSPHVRSNPNGLKYDNYGWKPSQGLFNKTYGTRGLNWDTPTWKTDPYYYEGKKIYENLHKKEVIIPNNLYPVYQKKTNKTSLKVIVPKHAHLSYSGSSWYCDDGYKAKYDDDFNKVGCEKD